MAEFRVSAHALDVIFKLEAESLATALPSHFGIPMPRIVRHFPTELPRLDVHLQQLDTVFLAEDESLLHCEYQSGHRLDDLVRFSSQDIALFDAYRRNIRTVIFYGPAVQRRPAPLAMPALLYRPHMILMGRRSGTRALRRIRAALAQSGTLDEATRLDLVFLPLMRHRRPLDGIVEEAVHLATRLPGEQQVRVLGPLLGLAYHYTGEAIVNRLMRDLMATSTFRQYFETALEQGLAQGLQRGEVKGRREDVVRILTRRFGAMPAGLEDAISHIDDLALLDRLLDAALTVGSPEEMLPLLQ
jgi:hypothetical protein